MYVHGEQMAAYIFIEQTFKEGCDGVGIKT